MFFFVCITLSLTLSGCGPKEIEPYQSGTEESNSESLESLKNSGMATTYPLSSYGTSETEQQQGAIEEENLTALEENLPLPEDDDNSLSGNSAIDDNSPIIETLDAGSGTGEQKLGFGKHEDKSIAYKKKHGRSSEQLKPVYFNFDQSNIRNDQIPHMEHNGEYLKSNIASNVLIEGNCDEQGTNEYNLALGERRAMNAKKYLIKLGVDNARIRTVSYGEERPLFTGSEESDYSYNRRADFLLE
jgi:peptidoglycan-associated lipoprotein